MAGYGQRHSAFSNEEKNYLLAEILKSAVPSPTILLNVILTNNIPLRWEDIPLPPGRSLNACRRAYEDLTRTFRSPLSRDTPQTPLSAPMEGLKRPWDTGLPHGARLIAPKGSGDSTSGAASLAQTSQSGESAPKRKRGRPPKIPPKVEAAPLANTVGAQIPAYAPREILQYTAPLPAIQSLPAISSALSPRASLPPLQRVPISDMLSTPTEQKAPSNSSSSSGKRRRGRSMRLEPSSMAHTQPPQYESPYAVPEQDNSPARAAIMRHREMAPISVSAPTPSLAVASIPQILSPEPGRPLDTGPSAPQSRPLGLGRAADAAPSAP